MEALIMAVTYLPMLTAWLVVSLAIRRLQRSGLQNLSREVEELLRGK